jgi:hypothetical protein
MSGEVLVLVPHGAVPDGAAIDGCRVVTWRSGDDVLRELEAAAAEGLAGVVLVSDGLPPDHAAAVVETVRTCRIPVVEVLGGQWDGFSRLDLSAAGRGMVSGFGIEGAWAAAKALTSPPGSRQ